MNYYKYKLVKDGNDFNLTRNDKSIYCPYQNDDRIRYPCGSWCPMFEINVWHGTSSDRKDGEGKLQSADVKICNRNIPYFDIGNFEILN